MQLLRAAALDIDPWGVIRAVNRQCIDCGATTRDTRCGPCSAAWASARSYNGGWPAVRSRVLSEEPSCRICGRPSADADHILPLRDGGTHARSNLQGLCRSCHRRKTVAETLARR